MKPTVTVPHFPDKLPIGISPDGQTHAFLYLLVSPLPPDFRVFLRRHAELLRALPAWSIQLLVPVEQTDTEGRAQDLADLYKSAFRLELGAPLDPVTANELRWFWEASTLASGAGEEKRMRRARRIFGTPGFGPCAEPWKSMARAPSTSPCREVSQTPSSEKKGGLNAMNCAVSISSLPPGRHGLSA